MDKKPEEKDLMSLTNETEQKANFKLDNLKTKAKEKINLGTKVKNFALTFGLVMGVVGGLCTGINYLVNKKARYEPRYLVVSGIDGPFNYTELTIYDDGQITTHCGLFSKTEVYIDEDRDGKVDQIDIDFKYFDRSTDFDENKDKFLEADKDFQEQLERFKPHIEKWKELYRQQD